MVSTSLVLSRTHHLMLAIHSQFERSLAIWGRCGTVRSKPNPRLSFRIRPAYWRASFSPIGGLVEGSGKAHTTSRGINSEPRKNRSWFGPHGQYVRELPCPDCRGRGYLPCTECGIDRPRSDCNTCSGEGKTTCPRCGGDCVTWEEFVDEQPWEKARSRSPLKVEEDDEVDNLEIKLDTPRKSRRVYKSPSPEVTSKISQSLKILNEKTGLFTNHMKRLHQDPVLRARRYASIKLAKSSPEARKKASESMRRYFSDPENRRKRSLAMEGVKFFCSNCGEQGHRKSFCPKLMREKGAIKMTCSLCGIKGHNSRSCPSKTEEKKVQCGHCGKQGHSKLYCPELRKNLRPVKFKCGLCGGLGHNRKGCPSNTEEVKIRCGHCGEQGHRKFYCPELRKNLGPLKFKCGLCGGLGHNRTGCPSNTERNVSSGKTCSVCGIKGHNKRSCPSKTEGEDSVQSLRGTGAQKIVVLN